MGATRPSTLIVADVSAAVCRWPVGAQRAVLALAVPVEPAFRGAMEACPRTARAVHHPRRARARGRGPYRIGDPCCSRRPPDDEASPRNTDRTCQIRMLFRGVGGDVLNGVAADTPWARLALLDLAASVRLGRRCVVTRRDATIPRRDRCNRPPAPSGSGGAPFDCSRRCSERAPQVHEERSRSMGTFRLSRVTRSRTSR